MPHQSNATEFVDIFGNYIQGPNVKSESIPVVVASDQVVNTMASIQPVTTSNVTSVASSTTVVTLLNANANRDACLIYNDSTQALYIKFGAACSTTSFSNKIAPGTLYEFDASPVYAGIVTAVWQAVNGSARITELSP